MNEQAFSIKTPFFEGPLHLLLHLIQKRKLFINDISLAGVTDEYISYIQQNNHHSSIDSKVSFVTVASTLLLIKSKSLLPSLELTQEEEEDIKNLELRLFFYKVIQEVSDKYISIKFLEKPLYARNVKQSKEIIFSPDISITSKNIQSNILDVLRAIPEPVKQKSPQIEIEKVFSLEDMITSLTERIQKSIRLSFSEFSNNKDKKTEQGRKVHVIVSFLALLELVRQGIIEAIQDDHSGDISIEKGLQDNEN